MISKNKKTETVLEKVAVMAVKADSVTIEAANTSIQGGFMKDKLVPILVVGIIAAAFAVGLLYGKVSVYEKGMVAGTQVAAGTQNQAAGETQDEVPEEEPVLTDEQWQQLLDGDGRKFGKEGAKVTIVEFTDFECPFCSRYFTETYTQLKKDYIDPGKVNYISYDLPLPFHSNAKPAALATRCADDQGKYWEMHDLLFEKQTEWTQGEALIKFEEYAGTLGLNTANFKTCYDAGKYNQAIDDDAALAQKVGASGTPTFFINGERLVGAQPYATFRAAIDKAL